MPRFRLLYGLEREYMYRTLMQKISWIDPFKYSYQTWLIRNTFNLNKQAQEQNKICRKIIVAIEA